MKPATDSWRVDETYIRPRRIKAQGGPDARVQALLERPAGSGRDIAGSKIIKGQFGLPKSFGTDPYMYGITCLPQGMYLSATDPFWPAAHEIRVNYSIWLGAIFLFVTGAGLFRWTHRSRSASIKQGKNDAVRHKIDESHDAMHLLIAFLLTVLASVFAQAQDADSSAPSPSPSPAPATYSSCHVDGPYIAMTFDDGPSPGNTTRLLDILKQRNIKVTFFMIGLNVVAHPEIVRRVLAEGHEIGNHSWTHPQLSKLSDQRVTEEITKTQEAIKNACGFTPTLLRPPYGAITKRQREWIENQFGLNVILWSVDPLDWKRPGAAVITQRILGGARPGAIILSHDIHQQTIDAMPATLDELLAKGYKFVTVSELIAMNHPKPPSAPRASSSKAPSPLARSRVMQFAEKVVLQLWK